MEALIQRAIQFEVDQHTYRLIEETEAGNERYECSVCEEDINIDFSKEEYIVLRRKQH